MDNLIVLNRAWVIALNGNANESTFKAPERCKAYLLNKSKGRMYLVDAWKIRAIQSLKNRS